MNLSDVLSGEKKEFVRGVVVDTEAFAPPSWLKSIGFLYQGSKDGIDDNLLDAIISYSINGCEVILEIPFGSDIPDISYLLSVASNAGFVVSFLPPESNDEDSYEKYKNILLECLRFILSKNVFLKGVYPVTNFLEYMFIEAYGGSPPSLDKLDPYIKEVFALSVSGNLENLIKSAMRNEIYRYFGGKENFINIANAILLGIKNKINEAITSYNKSSNVCFVNTQSSASGDV